MLEKLTTKQEQQAMDMAQEWISFCLNGDSSIDENAARDGVAFVYENAKLKQPKEIVIFDSPFAAQMDANKRNGTKEFYPMWLGLGYDAGWTAFYDFFTKIGILKDERFDKWVSFLRSGVWDTMLFENVAYLIRRPVAVLKDATGRLHCANGGAVVWKDGNKNYFWHGANVSEQIIMRPETITKDDIAKESNSEASRAMAEKLGWDKYLSLAETVLIDKWFDCNTKCHYELYDFKKRAGELQPRMLKMESPEVIDGTRPQYIEPVDPGLKTCQAARKWQFLKADGTWPTVEDCNKNPSHSFLIEA